MVRAHKRCQAGLHFIGCVFTRGGRWWSTARACGRQHECLMERAGSLGSTGESSPPLSLSLSLSLSLFSFSPSDITRDNVTRRSNKGTWRRDGRARGMDEVTDRLQGWGCAGPWFVFHGGGSSYRGFKSVALTFLEIHANLIRAHANLLGSNVRKVTPIDRRRRAGNMYFPSRIKTVRRASGASLLFTLTEFQSYFFYSLRSVYDRGKAISSVYRHPWLRHFIVVIMF